MSDQKVPKDVNDYQKEYSDSKFWAKVKSLGKSVLKPAVLLFYVMKSPDVPLSTKGTIAGALGYLILPLDLIADFIPVAGYTDDGAALMTVVNMCNAFITPQIKAQAEAKIDELLG